MKKRKSAPQERGAPELQHGCSARVVEVIELRVCVGKGTEENPNRVVTEYWSKGGKLLAVNDPQVTAPGHQPSLD